MHMLDRAALPHIRRSRFAQAVITALAAAALAACSSDSPAVAEATADSFTVAWNGARQLAVLDNDTVRDGEASISVLSAPANGSVTVSNGVLSYTPKAGFFGNDTLRYQLDVGDASSSAVVNIVVQAQLTLQGGVSDGPIANARVVASVGAESFGVDADAQGRYSLPIKSSNPSDFITLVATGAGVQSKVVLTSLVGEVGGLVAAANTDTLVSDTTPALMVTHLSAAQAGLMAQAGKLPSSNAELMAAGQKLDSSAVLDAGALVKLVVDAGVALPAAASSTRELLNSATLLAEFDAARRVADAAQLAAVRDAMLSDPSLMATPPLPTTAPVSLLFAYGAGGATLRAVSMELRPDGTATVVSDAVRPSRWRREGKVLTVEFDTPQTTSAFSAEVDASGRQWLVDRTSTGLAVSDLGATNGRYTLASISSLGYQIDQGGPQAGVKQASTFNALIRRYEANAAPLKADDFVAGGRWAGLLSEKSPNDAAGGTAAFKQDVLRIGAAGTGTMERRGVDVTWQVVDGALLVRIGDENFRYRRLGEGPLGEERWLLQQVDAASQPLTSSEIMAVRVTEPTVATADLARRWLGNLNAGVSSSRVFYTLKSDGTWAITTRNPGSPEPAGVFNRHWRRLADGRLDMVSSSPNACNPFAGVAGCRVSAQRYWSVLGQQGKTLYVMEAGPSTPNVAINSWRFVALTDAGPAPL